jgi:hypothetical protein
VDVYVITSDTPALGWPSPASFTPATVKITGRAHGQILEGLLRAGVVEQLHRLRVHADDLIVVVERVFTVCAVVLNQRTPTAERGSVDYTPMVTACWFKPSQGFSPAE